MAKDESQAEKITSLPQKVKFHYIKSNFFRVIHVDGALGGLTPSFDIFITLYSQRAPIPTLTVQPVGETTLGDEIMSERESKEGIIREAEVGAVMNLETAKALHQWLTDKIQNANEAIQATRLAMEKKS